MSEVIKNEFLPARIGELELWVVRLVLLRLRASNNKQLGGALERALKEVRERTEELNAARKCS